MTFQAGPDNRRNYLSGSDLWHDNLSAGRFPSKAPEAHNDSNKKEGKGEMTKTPITLHDLRRSLYLKAGSAQWTGALPGGIEEQIWR